MSRPYLKIKEKGNISPGGAAQVDFSKGPVITDAFSGEVIKAWIFVMALCFSRHLYAEVVKDQKVSTWVACHRRAVEFFNGVPVIAGVIRSNKKLGGMKMIRKRRMFAKMFGLLLSLLLLRVFTAQVLFAADVFSSDKHIKAGLNCDSCHGAAKVAAGAEVGMAKCLSCHGPYEKLAKRTEKISLNPHTNPHYGDLDCNVCHHGHRADENYCGSCHKK